MPWSVKRDAQRCSLSKPWAVVKDSDGSVSGCHATEAEAKKQQAALYASEPSMNQRIRSAASSKR